MKSLLKILCFRQINRQFLLHVNIYVNLGSSDGTLQIVDMRVGNYKKSELLIKAHDKDVNVCDWNRSTPNLIVTGSDDCSVKVWD
jgi:WD40 repeat protein